jgi:hypothetical protein
MFHDFKKYKKKRQQYLKTRVRMFSLFFRIKYFLEIHSLKRILQPPYIIDSLKS